jgi:cephalosporin-C deacetylase-like acetyl esterase
MIAGRLLLAAMGLTLAVCCLSANEQGQPDDLTVLPTGKDDTPPRKMFYDYLRGEAQKHFDARKKTIAALKTPEDVRRRQQELRTKFIEALGGFPEKTPLNTEVVGKEQRDGYRVERVIYESRPQHHVTANLYLPDGKGPFPGVLMPIGHSANGKAADYIQRGAILLAKNGMAVLAYDPIGQGERRQLLDARGKPAIASSTNEHSLTGVGALLTGTSTATYRIWDGIRSLDYLCSRPEIDAKKIGCTGCSGGGTLTSYLMALDDRIYAAAPSCYITSLERLFATIGPQDAEQNITGQVAFGMDHADYLLLHAPRPTLICAASRDFFDNQGTWASYREATLVYGVMGHAERVHLVEFDTTHGFPKPQREAVCRWMRRWLLGKDDAPVEVDVALAKDEALQCTRSGQVLEDFKGKSVFHLNAERDRELAGVRGKKLAAMSTADLLKEMRRLVALPDKVPLAEASKRGAVKRDGYTITKIVFEPEPGVLVPALQFDPAGGARGGVLYLHEAGMAADARPDGPIEKLVKAGNRVLALDPRGLGETAPGLPGKNKSYFGVDFKETYLALHLNRPLLGQRVRDVLAVVNRVAGDKIGEAWPVHVIGVGAAGPIALHAAALDERIRQVTLERCVVSWSAVVRTPISYNQLTNVVPGALAVYDLPDLAARLAPRPLTIQSAVDPAGAKVSQAALEESYAGCRAAYEKQNASKALVLRAGE